MNNIDRQYQSLLQDILDKGITKSDRTGTGTLSVFGRQIRHKMSEGFPLLTTKKMAWKSIVTELLWFLRGDTNIKFLVDNGCHIWNGDCYKKYYTEWNKSIPGDGIFSSNEYKSPTKYESTNFNQEEFINKIKTDDEFAKKWGDLGPIYGKQWRNWKKPIKTIGDPKPSQQPIDQIANLINDIKTNPDSRRLMVNAWNVGYLEKMTLPPCHYGFQVYTRELSLEERLKLCNVDIDTDIDEAIKKDSRDIIKKYLDYTNTPTRAISLMWNQRSVDTFLGLPFNIASYGLLLEIIAKVVNMVPDELIGNLGDVHLYNNHIEQAKEQIGRELSLEERVELFIKQNNGSHPYDIEMLDDYNILTRTREPYELPSLNINTEFWQTESGECGIGLLSTDGFISALSNDAFIKCLLEEDIQLGNYQSHPAIKAPLSN
jgi:thymidylate synthase